MNYLAELHNRGLSYSSLATARAAIGKLVELASETKLQGLILDVFLKGVLQSKPPRSKPSEIWDPRIVLDFIKTMPQDSELSLLDLGCKAVTLTALVSGQRVQTIAALTIRGRKDKGGLSMCESCR